MASKTTIITKINEVDKTKISTEIKNNTITKTN